MIGCFHFINTSLNWYLFRPPMEMTFNITGKRNATESLPSHQTKSHHTPIQFIIISFTQMLVQIVTVLPFVI